MYVNTNRGDIKYYDVLGAWMGNGYDEFLDTDIRFGGELVYRQDPDGEPGELLIDYENSSAYGFAFNWNYRLGSFEEVSYVKYQITVIDPNSADAPDLPDAGLAVSDIPDGKVKIHFGPMNDAAEDYYYIDKHDATREGLGLDGVKIQTRDEAQEALVTINDAIVAKDKIRAEYGTMQNRLENTITNLTIQAENLQVVEFRISDVDVAREMTEFVRNQVLAQSAIPMIAQANSMPQIAMRLIS